MANAMIGAGQNAYQRGGATAPVSTSPAESTTNSRRSPMAFRQRHSMLACTVTVTVFEVSVAKVLLTTR